MDRMLGGLEDRWIEWQMNRQIINQFALPQLLDNSSKKDQKCLKMNRYIDKQKVA